MKVSEISLKGLEIENVDETKIDIMGLPYWSADNETAYNNLRNKFDALEKKYKGYTLYAWYDVSGFDYWVNTMEEENYIILTIQFDEEEINNKRLPALKNRIEKMINKIENIIY